jgi:hypothetical protein
MIKHGKKIGLFLTAVMAITPFSSVAAVNMSGVTAEAQAWSVLEQNIENETEDLSSEDYDGYIVKVKDDLTKKEQYEIEEAVEETSGAENMEYTDGCFTVDSLETVQEVASAQDIEYIEPDYMVELFDSDMKGVVSEVTGEENNDHFALMNADKLSSYGINGVDMDTEYDMGNDGSSTDQIVIAVIDSGLDPDHEDIDYTHVIEGKSFVNTSTTADTTGHGTFVTGEIIATQNNGIGIEGIADDLYVMPLKVFTSGTTPNSVIVNAINYATEQKQLYDETNGAEGCCISVINMSLGGEGGSTAMKNACQAAMDQDIIVICAAGNDEDDRASYPAQYAIGVGSTKTDGVRDYYSQILSEKNGEGWENKVWVSGPGSYYTSLWYTGGYYYGSGTSFSSPQVATLAALTVSLKNDLKNFYDDTTNNHEAFKRLLKETSRFKDSTSEGGGLASNGQDIYYGWGLVDFANMIETVVDYNEQVGNDAEVKFTVDNGAGTLLSPESNNLDIQVFKYNEDNLAETPESPVNGVYNLNIGSKYHYKITADKYATVENDFVVLLPTREISVSMEGVDYFTSFKILNSAGENIPNASIEVKKSNGKIIEPNSGDCSFATKNGVYTYTVSAADYFPLTGTFTVDDMNNEYIDYKNEITLHLIGAQDICSVTVDIKGVDDDPQAEITIYDSLQNIIQPYADGAWKLEPGEYTYYADSDYYLPVNGSFTITENDKGSEKVITDTMKDRLYWAFLDIMPLQVMEDENTVVTLKNDKEEVIEPFNNMVGEYRIVNGKYSYTVEAPGYKTVKGSFVMNSKIQYIDVEMIEGEDTDDKPSGGSSGGSSSGGSGGTVNVPDDEENSTGKYDDITVQYHELQDVLPNDWFYEAVNFCLTVRVFNGISETEFGPNIELSRGMMATMLCNLAEGNGDITKLPFTDVRGDAYYAVPISWAYANGIVKGLDENSFGPDLNITREQLAVMLYNFADWAEKDPVAYGDGAMLAFSDYNKVSQYAEEAICWAYEQGLLHGDENGLLNPQSMATRAEAATLMMNFLKTVMN